MLATEAGDSKCFRAAPNHVPDGAELRRGFGSQTAFIDSVGKWSRRCRAGEEPGPFAKDIFPELLKTMLCPRSLLMAPYKERRLHPFRLHSRAESV